MVRLVTKEYRSPTKHLLFIILLKNYELCGMYYVLILSLCEYIYVGEEWAVWGCRVIYVEKSPFWVVLMVLYRPRSVALSLLNVCISEFLSNGAVEVVTVGKCYIFWICSFDAFVIHNYIWCVFLSGSGGFYGPVVV